MPRHMGERYKQGRVLMDQVLGEQQAEEVLAGFNAVSPDFGTYVVEAGFGDVYSRGALSLPERQLINIAVLTTIGGAESQLALHMRAALNVGVTADQIVETIFHTALYAGHPRAGNGLKVARDVLGTRHPHEGD